MTSTSFLLFVFCLLLEVLWADIAEGASQASCKFIQVPIVGLIDSILRIMPSCHASSAVTHHNDDVLHHYIPFIFMSYSLLVLFTACALNRNIADDKIHTPHLMLKSWRLEKIEDTEYGCVGWRMENGGSRV